MSRENTSKALAVIESLRVTLSEQTIQEQFKNALQDSAPLFIASLIDVYGRDADLQRCNPADVVREALKAATLKLPINKNLGFAYIVPYNNVPQFQVGYKGMIQLAIRSGQYRHINADMIYEGELITKDRLTGELAIVGQKSGSGVVGYFAYIETINGFKKAMAWSRDEVIAHAKRFSKSYGNRNSAWHTDFDAMALKTMLRNLLSKYGIMSVEMVHSVSADDPGWKAEAEDPYLLQGGSPEDPKTGSNDNTPETTRPCIDPASQKRSKSIRWDVDPAVFSHTQISTCGITPDQLTRLKNEMIRSPGLGDVVRGYLKRIGGYRELGWLTQRESELLLSVNESEKVVCPQTSDPTLRKFCIDECQNLSRFGSCPEPAEPSESQTERGEEIGENQPE